MQMQAGSARCSAGRPRPRRSHALAAPLLPRRVAVTASAAAPPHGRRQQQRLSQQPGPSPLPSTQQQRRPRRRAQRQQQQQQPLRGPPPAAAAAIEITEAAEPAPGPEVEFLGVLDGMQTVRGVMEVEASPDLVYSILTDYDRCSEVFENISASQTLEEEGAKQVIQACSWRFLALQGSFNVHLSVAEDAAARSLVFRLVKSSFMRDFEGRWHVAPGGSGGAGGEGRPIARVEHVLAVKPVMPIPGPIANYTKGIFTRQVANILRDLEREISVRAAAEAAAGGG